jgi:hypothetical protein
MENSFFFRNRFSQDFYSITTNTFILTFALLFVFNFSLAAEVQVGQKTAIAPELQKAARTGDLALLRSRLQAGDNPDARDVARRTPLINAVRAGQVPAARALVLVGADVNARDVNGVTALIEAAEKGRPDALRLLLQAGADVNVTTRGMGTALNAAERSGHNEIAAMLREAGAHSTGKSLGDSVCVLPWGGEGYCGTVESLNKNQFHIRVTEIVGCAGGCSAKAECSAGRQVGGKQGIRAGDNVDTVSWCVTQTGVQP